MTYLGKHEKGRTVGHCTDPKLTGRCIRILSGLSDEDEMDTLIHEALHALSWELFDETWVEKSASDIARLLRHAGFGRRA